MSILSKCYLPVLVFCCLLVAQRIKAQELLPIDKKATRETVNLYRHLLKTQINGIFFGHQDDLAYGVGWKDVPGNSDIKRVTGDYPAVYGWELGRIEIDSKWNIDSVPFDRMKQYIRQGYDRGGIITISWHLNNPLTGKTAWDPAPGTIAAILPGGEKHALFNSWLDKVAAFMADLKGSRGEFIPVIFRPFHEINGSWFWWGGKNASPDEMKQLWHYTIGYLRDVKQLHHLLYAYNTDRFSSEEQYLEKYPGDEWTDIVGFDIYQGNGIATNRAFTEECDRTLGMLERIALKRMKIPALTEFGYGKIPDSTWWTSTFLAALHGHHVAYALAWRNAGYINGIAEFYIPYPGQFSADDFKRLYSSGEVLFQKQVSALRLYQQ